jgi:hypothetical protein
MPVNVARLLIRGLPPLGLGGSFGKSGSTTSQNSSVTSGLGIAAAYTTIGFVRGTKTRWWGTIVKPDAFRLLTGEGELSDYQFGTKTDHHRFCQNCGVQPFGHGYLDVLGGEFYSINLACLDDLDPSELADASVTYFDGRNNDWQSSPAEIRHL